MKPIAAGLLALAVAGCAAPAAENGPRFGAGASEGTVLRRATLVVHDIEASIAFYEAIGFARWYDGGGGTVSGEGLPVDGVAPGDPTRLVIMKGAHPYVGMIGLLQYGERRALPDPGRMRHGDAIMMIETTGLAEIEAELRRRGHRIHQPLEIARIESVSSSWDAGFVMVFDPDGNMVELTERLN